MMAEVYIAAPFFTEEQKQIVNYVETLLEAHDLTFYSPMKECLYKPGDDTNAIFCENLKQISIANFIIAVTDGKDVGTMFEAGYAFGKTPIVYLWAEPIPGAKFNLMLQESSSAVCYQYSDLTEVLGHYNRHGTFKRVEVRGELQ